MYRNMQKSTADLLTLIFKFFFTFTNSQESKFTFTNSHPSLDVGGTVTCANTRTLGSGLGLHVDQICFSHFSRSRWSTQAVSEVSVWCCWDTVPPSHLLGVQAYQFRAQKCFLPGDTWLTLPPLLSLLSLLKIATSHHGIGLWKALKPAFPPLGFLQTPWWCSGFPWDFGLLHLSQRSVPAAEH